VPVEFDVTVVSSGHDVADARLHREVAALQRAGLSVEVLGLGQAALGPAGATVITWPRGGMVHRGLRAVRLPWSARGRLLVTLDPDVVPAALLVGRLRRRPVVADVHEDYVALLADRPWARRGRRVLQALAGRCIALTGRATVTVVADDHVPPQAARCRRRLVVPNLPDAASLPIPIPAPDRPPLRAVYVGDVRTSRGLRDMVEAVAAAPPWQLDIVGPVASADLDWLEQRLASPDLRTEPGLSAAPATAPVRVRVHGRQPPARAWQIAAGASVGMLMLADTPAFRDAVPTKLYEYLACGMAVVATPLPRVVPIITGAGAGAGRVGAGRVGDEGPGSQGSPSPGVLVADADEAAAVLRRWAQDPAELAVLRRAALTYAEHQLRGASVWDGLATVIAELLQPP
jgi:glycosyltransferase involved in cell wall biosynthesis